LGIDPADTAIALPDHFQRFSRRERAAWAQQAIAQVMADMVAEIINNTSCCIQHDDIL
jgi:hypothetical protein